MDQTVEWQNNDIVNTVDMLAAVIHSVLRMEMSLASMFLIRIILLSIYLPKYKVS